MEPVYNISLIADQYLANEAYVYPWSINKHSRLWK